MSGVTRLTILAASVALAGCVPSSRPLPLSDETKRSIAEIQRRHREQERRRMVESLPPRAVVTDDADREWWAVEVDGVRYLAHWEQSDKGGGRWHLAYAGEKR